MVSSALTSSSSNLISRALNDPNLASNVSAELLSLVTRATKSKKKKSKKIKAGPIAGIVIAIVVVIIILLIVFLVLRRRKQKKLQAVPMQQQHIGV